MPYTYPGTRQIGRSFPHQAGCSQPERNAVDAVTMETESVDTDYRGAAVDGEGWNGRGGWGVGVGMLWKSCSGRIGACVGLVGGYYVGWTF